MIKVNIVQPQPVSATVKIEVELSMKAAETLRELLWRLGGHPDYTDELVMLSSKLADEGVMLLPGSDVRLVGDDLSNVPNLYVVQRTRQKGA